MGGEYEDGGLRARKSTCCPLYDRALKAQRAATDGRSVWVFPSDRGGALNISNLRERVWRPALRQAGFRERTMYQTRHTFATLALSSGEALDWVSKLLGHRTTQMVTGREEN